MMISFKKTVAALRALVQKGLDQTQTGARSTQGGSLNYNSVTTLDPARLASAFAAADQGFIAKQAELFELVEERDPHIFAELAKRRRSVTGLSWQLQPPRDATQSEIDRTNELTDMVKSIEGLEDAQYDLTDAVGKGLVALEMNWQAGDAWLPKKLEFVPQRHFQTDRDSGDLLYLNMGIAEPLRPMGWLVHEHRAKSGYIEQAALFRVLAWTYAYKAYNIKDMQRFLEVYGLPLRLGKYPAGIGDKQRNELLKAVRSIGNDGAGVVPSTMSIDFLQAQTGKIDDFLNTVAYWESKQSKAILGGELDGKTTSEARIMLYDKVRKEILEHDVKQLNPTYTNGLLKPICLINGLFPENRLPTWHHDTEEPADQQALVDVLIKAAGLGMEIDIDWAHGSLQIPRAKEGAVLLTTGATANKAALRLAALSKAGNTETSITESLATQLTALSMPFEQAQLERIAAIVGEAGDFESALAEIAALNSAPIYKEWINTIAKGMTAAHLAGRVEAVHE
jgi:phage gp29-like protein